jgi:hypothetical protein
MIALKQVRGNVRTSPATPNEEDVQVPIKKFVLPYPGALAQTVGAEHHCKLENNQPN